ncbi:hypothetical protein K461DRAFT_219435 [Myriangium duriaei CBS 260.36]|uniref:BTB domain-containing protein n=1 Tax=Myriangium duriaei CBS 260.36 TaxID=1168546 RepID=A0A9P4MLQ7_9PEZI|nr:hypothetical protein K461DRAFT_219435 [Myriangium duriaei CBS 260.36]
MFKHSVDRVAKLRKPSKRSFRDEAKAKLRDQLNAESGPPATMPSPSVSHSPLSPIITIVVGSDQRMFAAHEDVLQRSPFFAATCKDVLAGSHHRRIALVDEEPEVLSAVLEYLYKGDYSPRLLHDKKRNSWVLEDGSDMLCNNGKSGSQNTDIATIHCSSIGDTVLRDTAVYCSAERYGLEELKRLALRKQGLVTGIDVATILRSARFAYDNTPETDSRLRAFYLAMIVRNRKTFKRSKTMQMEMEAGGKMFFDLFVAMCNHVDDILEANVSPKGLLHTV